MISPHTPPGTHLVAVWLEDLPYALAVFRPEYHGHVRALGMLFGVKGWGGVKLGRRYVLTQIKPNKVVNSGFAAFVEGFDGAYPLECFDVAVLPKAITELLASKPVDTRQPEKV